MAKYIGASKGLAILKNFSLEKNDNKFDDKCNLDKKGYLIKIR